MTFLHPGTPSESLDRHPERNAQCRLSAGSGSAFWSVRVFDALKVDVLVHLITIDIVISQSNQKSLALPATLAFFFFLFLLQRRRGLRVDNAAAFVGGWLALLHTQPGTTHLHLITTVTNHHTTARGNATM